MGKKQIGKTDEQVESLVASLVDAGDKLSWTYDGDGDSLAIDTSALDKEEVEDAVASLIMADANLTINYDDASDTITIGLADDVSVNTIDAATVSAGDELNTPVYPTEADLPDPTTQEEGAQAYVQSTNAFYVVEDV